MRNKTTRNLIAISLLAGLAGAATLAQAQGVATPSPVAPQPQLMPGSADGQPQQYAQTQPYGQPPQSYAQQPYGPQPYPQQAQPQPYEVTPEPGVVVSGGPAPVYAPAPAYYPAPVYVQPAYAYPAPYIYPPVGLSLNLGYSRGWHGGRWR